MKDNEKNNLESKPWIPTRKELRPFPLFFGTQEYAWRWKNYFYSRNWPLRSPNEMQELERKDPSYATCEERITYKKFSRIGGLLATKDAATFLGACGAGLYLLDKLLGFLD